jgi:hypothetical protein
MIESLQWAFSNTPPAFTTIGFNFILVIYSLFQIQKFVTKKDKLFLVDGLIALVSPILFCIYVLVVTQFLTRFSITVNIGTAIQLLPGLCLSISLAMLAFSKSERSILSNDLFKLLSQTKVGIVGGLLVFGIILIAAAIIFIKTASIFGDVYINIGWKFFYYPTMSRISLLSKLWAYGFFMLFTDFFYIGLFSPFLCALNGAAWTNGKRSFALLLTAHLLMFYIQIPIILAIMRVDP